MPPPFWVAISVRLAKRAESATKLPRPVSALRPPSVYWQGAGEQTLPRAPLSEVPVVPMTAAFSTAIWFMTGVTTLA